MITQGSDESHNPRSAPRNDGSQETRSRLLAAARDVFQTEGFDRASTRAIAARADVNAALIFRYFGSKAGLYQAAILRPLQAFIDDYVAGWQGYEGEPHSGERVASEYLGGLYDLFRGHRELVLALVRSGTTREVRDAEEAQVAEWVTRLLDGVQQVVDGEADRRGWTGFREDGGVALRMSLGLAFSMAVLDDWIWSGKETRPTRDQIVRSMASFVLRSMSNPGGIFGYPGD